jgi:transcriptional regulator with XRE-family HTH domain
MAIIEPITQSELITQRLAEIGMSVSAFARELGVRPSFVHAIKKGQRRLTRPATVERAAHILGLPADILYVSAGHFPPDCWTIIQRRPELVQGLRLINARIDAREAQHAPR